MVKINADLINKSAQFLNPVKEFQLDLRGYKIGVIENLSASNDQFGCIDLSDNSITKLEGLPKLHRLRSLLLINNRVMKVENNFSEHSPNLENLILTNNKVRKFNKPGFYYKRNR
jgi:U2 small nuclear ribonucleoprotein A'